MSKFSIGVTVGFKSNVIPDSGYDIMRAAKAQELYCEKEKVPHFAPFNGNCLSCHKNIYKKEMRGEYSSGISVARAESSLVTGCPHCNKSYCE